MSSAPPSASTASPLAHALALARAGRRHEAIGVLRGLIAREPAQIPARCLLGALLQETDAGDAALHELDAAAAIAPDDPSVHELRASVLLGLRRTAAAEDAARIALRLDPQRPRALLYLGMALDTRQCSEETITTMRTLLRLQPDQPTARRMLARALLRSGDAAGALDVVRHPSALDDAHFAQDVAADFCASGCAQAHTLLYTLSERHPHNYALSLLYARLLHQSGRSSEALQWSERAHALDPAAVEPLEMRAVSLIDRGDVEPGLALYDELLARPGADAETASRHLILAHYDPRQDNAALFAAHVDWARRYAQPLATPYVDNAVRDAERPLRIGWISPRFAAGPVATFLTGLLRAFDRTRFTHHLIALQPGNDSAHAQLRELGDAWMETSRDDDATLLQRLRDAQFDIVIDLAGHSFGNRLRVLAQRVAPIQLCWLDYFDTTGIAAMDGWISDAWLTPPQSPQRYTERVLRLPAGRFCYTPPADAPEPSRHGAGAPVFASFNRLAKCNDAVLDAWAEILQRVPQAQLELGTQLLGDGVARARTLERVAQRGIDAGRLRLHARRSYAELLEAYRGVDIALDPFPFSGCTSSCDALWMGVPVIALSGDTFVARQSASLLVRLGRAEWIAHDAADYVARAVAMAQGIDEIRASRTALRGLARVRLCDAQAQAHDFATLLRELWREHCAA